MKSSHFTTPRSLDEAHWDARGQALHHFPCSGTEHAYSLILAVAIGVLGALALVHWWAA